MADSKISALTAITVLTPATDVLPVVDSGGVTKKITTNQILGSGGTATLASATITGDLIVDTNTLKVDSANNRVGIVQATPLYPLHLVGEFGLQEETPAGSGTKLRLIGDATKYNFRLGKQLTATNAFEITPSTAVGGTTFSNPVYTVTYDGIHTFLDGAGSTRMTLNSTGLGVGTSPTNKLDVNGNASFTGFGINANPLNSVSTTQRYSRCQNTGGDLYVGIESSVAGGFFPNSTAYAACLYNAANVPMHFYTNSALRMTLDASGNVGIGVTPSAWAAAVKALQIGSIGCASYDGTNYDIASNRYLASGGTSTYIANGRSTMYRQVSGTHLWFYDSGTQLAGGNCAFTQAMTLDGSGNLLLGKTAAGALGTVGIEVKNDGQVFSTRNSSVNADTTYHAYSSSAAAYRFYVGMGGTVFATNTTISAISDARFKENVQDIDVGLSAILALKPRKFDWKAGKGKDIKGDRGFIAQEFEQVFPQLVDEWADPSPEGEAPYKSVRQDLIPVLVKAIQELAARVQTLEAR